MIVQILLHPREIEDSRQGRLGPDNEIVRSRFDKGSGEIAVIVDHLLPHREILGPFVFEIDVHLHDTGSEIDRLVRLPHHRGKAVKEEPGDHRRGDPEIEMRPQATA